MQDTWYALINPAAGNGRSLKRWNTLKKELDHLSIPYTFSISTHRGHITELSHIAIRKGYSRFISVGGDGTHHELINGLLSEETHRISPMVAVLNAGTGNDWSRMHHIPGDIAHCTQMIANANTIDHAAGLITYTRNGETKRRYFVNVAGMALDGRVMEKFPEKLRKYPFLPGYLIAGLKQLMVYKTPTIQIITNEESFQDEFITVHAGICKYSGGGMQFVPHADPFGSDLAITCIRKMSIPRLLGNIHRIYLGTLLSHPRVKGLKCQHISITSPVGQQIPIEADGEFLGYSPVTIHCIPKAFKLVIP
ncbi:MAG TPA: diacylglycerol kinase family protein [Saprospiraceae bacterium]|nr:diacylglycerol kinase family protein [Saprospiraceae bacterium]